MLCSSEQVPSGHSTNSDFASWESLDSERSWESPFLKHEEWSANLWANWNLWLDWDLSAISDPPVVPSVLRDSSDLFIVQVLEQVQGRVVPVRNVSTLWRLFELCSY